jgi:hypothetical protein
MIHFLRLLLARLTLWVRAMTRVECCVSAIFLNMPHFVIHESIHTTCLPLTFHYTWMNHAFIAGSKMLDTDAILIDSLGCKLGVDLLR